MLSQNCSLPARQFGHTRSESTMQPTAARSPSLNFFTALPVLATRPTISCPGTHGYTVGIMFSHSLRTWCRSEWQTPQNKISICTSVGPGSRRRIAAGASPEAAFCAAYALAGYAFPFALEVLSSATTVEVMLDNSPHA